MPTFLVELPPGVNNSMLELYNNYKKGIDIDDCWKVTEDDDTDHGPYYKEHPIQMKDCPIFESADHNIDTIDAIGSFHIIESPNHSVCFDRCKENAYWSRPYKIENREK